MKRSIFAVVIVLVAISSLAVSCQTPTSMVGLSNLDNDKAQVEEAYHLLSKAGNSIWSGWGDEKIPSYSYNTLDKTQTMQEEEVIGLREFRARLDELILNEIQANATWTTYWLNYFHEHECLLVFAVCDGVYPSNFWGYDMGYHDSITETSLELLALTDPASSTGYRLGREDYIMNLSYDPNRHIEQFREENLANYPQLREKEEKAKRSVCFQCAQE